MAELRISARAEQDLIDLREFGIENFGARAALRHLDGLLAVFDLLRDHPRAGQERPDWGGGIRTASYRPHRILYRVVGERVIIVRVLHASRDVRLALLGRR